ncbi:hypothetical protein Tco_1081084 [Tanacetum coccineum]|uniref:Eukaryotic translation initiation factor 3 subunit G N-terminal domain-containing protein n=1 Tax=Tanacetum coccineum TaxID=301880 RepID=A0ABQ5HXG8_9ASTR
MFTEALSSKGVWKICNWVLISLLKKLNLTMPDTVQINLRRRSYTPYSDPRGFIYENKDKKNRLMELELQYLPPDFWSQRDKANARAMIQAIDKRLKTRRIMRSLERFVEFRSSRRHFKSLSLDELRSPDFNLFSDQEYSEEEEAEAMAETIEQYMSKTRTDYGSGVARPKIEEKDSFELNGKILKEIRENTFSGLNNEDANEHIEKNTLKKWHNGTSRGRSTETSDGMAAIQAQLNNLGREIKKVNEKVYVAQVGCEQCKGPHYTKDCPLKEEGKTLEEAYYTQFGGPFQGGGYRATALGFYQRNNANPSYQERRQSMEDTLSKFMGESAKRHEENSNLIKEI